MKDKKYIRHKADKRLTAKLSRPGGITAREALARANECLETAHDYLYSALEEKVAGLPTGAIKPDDVPDVYATSAEILSIAGTLGSECLTQAARSLCDLIDGGGNAEREGFPRRHHPRVCEVVLIHVNAMRIMSHPCHGDDPSACQELVAGLRQATHHVS